ncbi:hypothetical protein QFC21_002712 [Naganishia friedmannii]|uniref:Uncharacterized protein n=1 Tax=Naganishia friedmannii TaxID=89922 RepID=A0ACC2VWB6_9TREE|nr:hypothetical protein QFC21_002712 [Naganishia friedmannii]
MERTPSTTAVEKETSGYGKKLQVYARSLQDANKHFAKLEAEVKTLKRKLAVTEIGKLAYQALTGYELNWYSIDLVAKSKALNDATENSGTVAKPPIKRRKKVAESPQKNSTLDLSASTPVQLDLPTVTTSSLATKNTEISVPSLDQSLATNTGSAKAASRKPAKAKKASYVNIGTSTEDCLTVMGLLQGTDAVASEPRMQETFNAGLQTHFSNMTENFKLIQTLLLPPVLPQMIQLNEEEHQTALLDQALDVISQLSQSLQLAYDSATISQGGVHQVDLQNTETLDAADGHHNVRTPVQDPTRMVSLVVTLLTRFLPAILGRLQGSDAHGKVIFAVAKGLIRPAIDQITFRFSSTRRMDGQQVVPDGGTLSQKNLLQATKELLEGMLQVVPTYYLADHNDRPGKVSPFAEVIALWSIEALSSGIKTLETASSASIIIEVSTLNNTTQDRDSANDGIATLVELLGRCISRLNSGTTTVYGSNSNIGKRTVKSVATRLCDSITQLVAGMEAAVNLNAAAGSTDAKVDTRPITDRKESDGDHHDSTNFDNDKQMQTMPLWFRLGIDRENMLAMCGLAEGLMVRECQAAGDEMYGGVYEWLEDLVK